MANAYDACKPYFPDIYGSEAICWALDWAFSYANMHRIGLDVYEWNPAAMEAYGKVGFCKEGRRRESLVARAVLG